MNLFFGFVIGQLMCYISNVKKYTKKSVILTDNTFLTPPLTRLYRRVILASLIVLSLRRSAQYTPYL